ncbi:hypothetical protein HK22_02045 [Gluconobacter sp. DsW_056]|uniref:putative phage tail protein n=1 Tax=Gluconobacter sp. DsW_056 TaxID=1511209 RepID=UPI000A3CB104|nr:putative phage tail protein [Gluconobacter sp. DsW_056]OUI81662.1 hypothetical protein HK22_02045 [Gluconobacter sp. DsW_056]
MGVIRKPNTQDDYYLTFSAMQPQGLAWTHEPGSLIDSYLKFMANSFADFDNDICDVADDFVPTTMKYTIPEWLSALELKSTGNDAQDRANIIAQLTMTGSTNPNFYINYANGSGYSIRVKEYGPIITGIYRCGDACATMNDISEMFAVTFISENQEDLAPLEQSMSDILPAWVKCYFVYQPLNND